MTGVERFAKMMDAAEFALAIIEDPKDRATGVAQVMAANAISLAAELIRDHDYGGAHDVILTADAVITALLNDHLNDPRYAKVAAGMLARVNGHDVPLSAMVDLEPAPIPVRSTMTVHDWCALWWRAAESLARQCTRWNCAALDAGGDERRRCRAKADRYARRSERARDRWSAASDRAAIWIPAETQDQLAPPSETSGGRMTMAEIDALSTED